MKEIEISELKKIEMGILCFFHNYCEEHGLHYFLAGGTLLGAVRHGGFIPWDDDIDVVMPRSDYEKLINEFSVKNNNERFGIIHIGNNKNYYLPFAKVIDTRTVLNENLDNNCKLAVFIDVFPIDFYDLNSSKLNRFYKRQTGLIKIANMKTSPYQKYAGAKKQIVRLFRIGALFVTPHTLAKAINDYAYRHSHDNGKLACLAVTLTYGKKEFMDASIYSKRILLNFEGETFYAPEKYDVVLKNLYGDYMKLPPREKQMTQHDFKAFFK